MTADTFDKFQPPDRGRFGDNELAPTPAARGPRVTGASDLKGMVLMQHAKTAKGILVSKGLHDVKPVWLPLSEVEIEDLDHTARVWNDDYRHHAPVVKVTAPEWLLRSKGLQ